MFRRFSSIEQFKNVIKIVKDHCKFNNMELPIIKFTGTVKLHGTQSTVGYDIKTGEMWAQSRERIISPESDNYGFASWVLNNNEVKLLLTDIINYYDAENSVYIQGEFAGGKIQKGVALSQLEKAFYVFEIIVDDKVVGLPPNVPLDFTNSVFFTNQFETFEVDIDFNNPAAIQNKLVELTLAVEQECPVGKARGVSGIGEGIVWIADWEDKVLKFKVKGEKHSASKIKTVKEIALVDVEKINSMIEFVEYSVSENRLNQGLEKLKELGLDPDDNKSTGDFLRWIVGDINREERDVIEKSEFDIKQLNSKISSKARTWFINR